MAAIGLSDMFKYGGKFLGYLVAVVLAGGVLVGGGAFLAATGGLSLTDPSIGSAATSRAIVGALLVVIGGVISLSGLFGLAHKLVADAAAVAVESATATAATPEAGADVETEQTDDADESAESGAPAVAEGGEETPLGGADTTGTVTEQPETDRPVDEQAPEEPPTPVTNEPGPSHARTDATPAAEAPSDGEDPPIVDGTAETAGPTATEPSRSGVDSGNQSDPDDFVDQSATDDDWTESKYATGTRRETVDDAPEPTGANEGDISDGTGNGDPGRTEWTPPDPAEFEQSGETSDDSVTDPDSATTGEAETVEDDTTGGSDEEVRTWDDVRNASSGSGIEAEKATTDVDRTESAEDAATETTDLIDAEDAAQEPSSRDEPNFADEESAEGNDVEEPVVADDEDEDEADDEDLTLADEGISSFEVEGDSDPLGDRLSGDGN